MIKRQLPTTVPIQDSTASTSLSAASLPGLVSSLRPLKRSLPQLQQEAALLRRFCYKNKNQHKANAWWKRIIHVDRVIGRLTDELKSLLVALGLDAETDQNATLEPSSLLVLFSRLPRASLVVTKAIEVLFSSSETLSQLVHSRAFLPFSLVLTSLHARLYAITLALQQDLAHAARIVAKLIRSVESSEDLVEKARRYYRDLQLELRAFVPNLDSTDLALASITTSRLNSEQVSTDLTPIVISDNGPEGGIGDDIGTVISREELMRLARGKIATVEVVDDSNKETIRGVPVPEEQTSAPEQEDVATVSLPPPIDEVSKKKRRRDLATENLSKPKKVKKKKSKKDRDDQDEIDEIFG
ncbi:BZ3500_MvSof-1268-A1-R1_Chr3-1g05954 [Microbotryum saponariae]|uniref:BZ3500_MvSof-1268-A1-R1_Chr3-1g05954 protein n=1 Tax=Microbotryum saponariae TaxID=289078 RepID=A0A2X0LSQ1_9BASI|nr:BZ3500_MvSof-1268-A1-R1_Chr3-1g05954 [Microbotryum saponariae]SDA05144.1 BZ3501_MvSof-1269-A2-R1_Chr3-1g05624 [Microbotryum saponariae]